MIKVLFAVLATAQVQTDLNYWFNTTVWTAECKQVSVLPVFNRHCLCACEDTVKRHGIILEAHNFKDVPNC